MEEQAMEATGQSVRIRRPCLSRKFAVIEGWRLSGARPSQARLAFPLDLKATI